jgi:hypothetical protein
MNFEFDYNFCKLQKFFKLQITEKKMFKIIVSLLVLALNQHIQSIQASIVFDPPGSFSNYPRLTCTTLFHSF